MMRTLALLASMAFPDATVTWNLVSVEHARQDATLAVYTLEPSSDVGCQRPRFVADVGAGLVLAIYCQDDAGQYHLLAY